MIWEGILEMLSDDVADILAGDIDPERIVRHLVNIRKNVIPPRDSALEVAALSKNISVPPDLLGQIEEALEILGQPNGEDFEGRLILSLQEMVLALGGLRNLDNKDIGAALEGKFSLAKKTRVYLERI